jgi:hypothetical protein
MQIPTECPTDNILGTLENELKELNLNPTFIKSDMGYFSPPKTIYYTCDTLRHEIIHFLDYSTTKFNMEDASHVACSEIRANALSGDCDLFKEIRRGNWPNFDKCVKRRAKNSVVRLGLEDAVVDKVYNECILDTYPFN